MRNMAVRVKTRFKDRKQYDPTYIRQWREYRGLSQDRLVDRLGEDPETGEAFLTKTSLSRIELGKQPYSQRILERLADALDCKPGNLLDVNPLVESAPWSLWEAVRRLSKERLNDVAKIVEAFQQPPKTGTDG